MKWFKPKNASVDAPAQSGKAANQAAMAEMTLKAIHDGVMITDKAGVVQFINPAAAAMTGVGTADKAVGLDYGLVLRIESKEGRALTEAENPLVQAMVTGQVLEPYQCMLIVGQSDKRVPVAISVLPAEGLAGNRIITFRDIAKELEEEGEQTEFISTASHEMRTPVATIDGYLSLALNPQTAAVDERARGYLTAAQAASKHLGKLFQDLLDVTKLDDGRIRPHFVPVEMVGTVEEICRDYLSRAKEARVNFTFGSSAPQQLGESRRIEQVAYSSVDMNFLREILDNLIDNALKYTPEGGSVYVNVRGDGDRVLLNVTDTGMGISSEDLAHIFQKFYRADNSDTRTIGGTGLGLYLVKQRAEAMGGRVWAESAFGEGSTFFVSLPRISPEEYEKRMIAVKNQEMVAKAAAAAAAPVAPAVGEPAQDAPSGGSSQAARPSFTPSGASEAGSLPTPAPAQPAQAAVPAQPVQPAVSAAAQIQTSVASPPNVTKVPQQIDINLNGGRK